MNHVRLTLDAGGQEAAIHPMFDIMVNAPYIDRATAMHWNFAGDRLGIMHHVEGDVDAFRAAVAEVPEVIDFTVTEAGDDAFYAYILDATNEAIRELFEIVDGSPAVVIPPVEYGQDGSVSYSVYGPSEAIQTAIERIPEPIEVTVSAVGGLEGTPGLLETLLSERQREAIAVANDLGYYELPRETTHEEIARELDCAPSTAAEHLRKAESTLLRSLVS